MNDHKEPIILIAEDDDGHAELIREGFISAGVCNTMIRFTDGLSAWQFLSGTSSESGTSNTRDPNNSYLLLLDINMPAMDGYEVLKRIKSSETLKEIPIIILTTTDDQREVEECYRLGCNMYITKPIEFSKFAETLKRLGLFLQIVKF